MRVALSFLLLFIGSAASAREFPGERFTRFSGFDLGRTTLADVQARFGSSRIRESGDAGEYLAEICYAAPFGEVRFMSPEIGGGVHLLGYAIDGIKSTSDCPASRHVLPAGAAGLELGMTRRRFQSILGTHVDWTPDTGSARFEFKTTMPSASVDTTISIIGTFRGDRLIKLVVWRIEST